MLNPHKEKFHRFYWIVAHAASRQSVAAKRKVGCVIVTPQGMLSIGFNGMPAGMDNNCEIITYPYAHSNKMALTTKAEAIHAERNAIDKMCRQGVSIEGSIMFITANPCIECAKSIHGLGFKEVHYENTRPHSMEGINLLNALGIPIILRK